MKVPIRHPAGRDPHYDPGMNRRLAVTAAPLAFLAACSSGSSDRAAASSTSSSDTPSEVTTSAPSGGSDNSGTSDELASAQPLGTESTVNYNGERQYSVTVTAYEPKIAVAYEDQAFLGLKSGEHWSRARVKACTTKLSPINWFMFSAIDAGGGAYKGIDQSFHDPFPGPVFPEPIDGIPAGACRSGWIYIPVPDGVTIKTVNFQDGGAATDWSVQ